MQTNNRPASYSRFGMTEHCLVENADYKTSLFMSFWGESSARIIPGLVSSFHLVSVCLSVSGQHFAQYDCCNLQHSAQMYAYGISKTKIETHMLLLWFHDAHPVCFGASDISSAGCITAIHGRWLFP